MNNISIFDDTNNIAIKYYSDNDFALAKKLSSKLDINVVGDGYYDSYKLFLVVKNGVLSLTDNNLSMEGDFSKMSNRLKPNNLNGEMIVKACKIKGSSNYSVLDATAGMGEDSFLLSASGFNVTLCEYNKIIYSLLENTFERATEDKKIKSIVQKMKIKNVDSIEYMKSLTEKPDIILLDPMFPERKKSGLIKKKFQLLQQLELPDSNGAELINTALSLNPKKIVIKRPIDSEYLGNIKPDYFIEGNSIRYDCIIGK